MKSPLLSVIILAYNNQEYIYETLESIFKQDYGNIELLISDDASNDFDETTLMQFINEHKTPNITNLIINRNEHNLGTVKHLEIMREKCKGDYITSIAADDVYNDIHVFSKLMSNFEKDKELKIITSRVGMYDATLEHIYDIFTTDEEVNLINSKDYWKLFEAVCSKCFIAAAGTIYRKEVFDIIGRLSDKYCIIEDWTSQLRYTRLGLHIYCMNIISVKHREGGISHGNKKGFSKSYTKYVNDFCVAFENEIMPYLVNMSTEKAKDAIAIYQCNVTAFEQTKAEYDLSHKLHIPVQTLRAVRSIKSAMIHLATVHNFTQMFCASACCIIIAYATHSFYPVLPGCCVSKILLVLTEIIFCLGIIFAATATVLLMLFLFFSIWLLFRYGTLHI